MGKVVLIACTNVGRSLIEAIKTSKMLIDVDLVGIVNLKPEVAINKANYDSYIDLVQKYSLNIYYCNNVNEPECIDFLKSCSPDVIIQSGWSQKFSQTLLDIPRFACIGEHPAPLPKGRGAACVNWAILTGEREWGDTFFKMEMQYDTGVIYSQEYFNIELYDDVKTVYDKVAMVAVRAVEKHLSDWCSGKLNGYVQDDSQSTHYGKRTPSDGEFDFSKGALNIYNHIRAQARPYPGAFFYQGNKKIYVWQVALDDQAGGVEFKCGDGKNIYLLRVQEAGLPEMWAVDYFKQI